MISLFFFAVLTVVKISKRSIVETVTAISIHDMLMADDDEDDDHEARYPSSSQPRKLLTTMNAVSIYQ